MAIQLALALALTTNPTTLDQLHQTGCTPVTWPQPGVNQLAWRGDRQACAGQTATIVYDQPDGTIHTRLIRLDADTYTVDPALLGCGRTQVDLFVGDIRAEILQPGWNPANRLITVNWLDGTNCAPPTTITFSTTPLPTIPLGTTPSDPLPPTATTTTADPQAPPPPSHNPPVTVGAPKPELPATGGRAAKTATQGAWVLGVGVFCAALGRLRRHTKGTSE